MTHMQSSPTAAAYERICFLHIGPHKTGTTSIQAALFQNARRLEAVGYAYPTVTDVKSGKPRRSHTPLLRAPSLKPDDLRDSPMWREVEGKIAAFDGSVVISSEHFAEVLREERHYERIVAFFMRLGFRVVVVGYIRDQPSLLNSWYTQDQRNFASRMTFQQFRDHAIERGLLDPCAYFARAIEDPRVEVRAISFEQTAKQGLARKFFDAIGIPASFDFAEPNASNANLGVKGVYAAQEIMRRVEGRIRSMPNYNDLYDSFRALMRDRDWAETAYVGLTPEDLKVVRDRYRESNEAFAQRWFATGWTDLAPEREFTERVFDFDAASEADKRDVMEVVDRMVELVKASPSAASEFIRANRPAGKKAKVKPDVKPKARDLRAADKLVGLIPPKLPSGGDKVKGSKKNPGSSQTRGGDAGSEAKKASTQKSAGKKRPPQAATGN